MILVFYFPCNRRTLKQYHKYIGEYIKILENIIQRIICTPPYQIISQYIIWYIFISSFEQLLRYFEQHWHM